MASSKPSWLRLPYRPSESYAQTVNIVRQHALHTVCQEAACPNITQCWSKKHAAFMILGDTCTRSCRFCHVKTGKPAPVDMEEPRRIAEAVQHMGLKHAVITSVDRDDLEDGGAMHFVRVICAIRERCPDTSIEILTPDFLRKPGALALFEKTPPDVFNHNVETVPRLYRCVRPGARYFQSLHLLASFKEQHPEGFTKSGMMLGLGETIEEVYQVMDDLIQAGVDFLTLGQYMQPTPKHHKVVRYVPPQEFEDLALRAKAKGFLMVSSSPLTRSSFHADKDFETLKQARKNRKKT